MPKYMLSVTISVLCAAFEGINELVPGTRKRKRIWRIVTVTFFLLSIANIFLEENLPNPEFYMSNGNKKSDNMGYFQVEFPFSVYYTFEPYADPKKEGIKYKKPFKKTTSFSIRYSASFMGILWGETKSEDVILKSNGEKKKITTNKPGRSIAEITAYLKENNFMPGDKLSQNDFIVKGKTIAGDKLTIEEFKFTPSKVVEGENHITIDYDGLISQVDFWVHAPQIVSITAKYQGEDIVVGSEIKTKDIQVIATYDDEHMEEISDFEINPVICYKEGENAIKVSYKDFSDNIFINAIAEENIETSKEPLFSNCYESHDSNSIIPQITFGNWDNEKKDIQGNSYDESQLYIAIGDLFNQIQDAGDSYIDSTVTYIINPNYNLKKNIHVKGRFVVDNEYLGSNACMDITIKVDGEEKWRTNESISGNTISPMTFEFDVTEGAEAMTMEFHCNARGSGLGLGIIFDGIS